MKLHPRRANGARAPRRGRLVYVASKYDPVPAGTGAADRARSTVLLPRVVAAMEASDPAQASRGNVSDGAIPAVPRILLAGQASGSARAPSLRFDQEALSVMTSLRVVIPL